MRSGARNTMSSSNGQSRVSIASGAQLPTWDGPDYAAGFGKFVEYQTRNVAEGLAAAFPQASEAVQ